MNWPIAATADDWEIEDVSGHERLLQMAYFGCHSDP